MRPRHIPASDGRPRPPPQDFASGARPYRSNHTPNSAPQLGTPIGTCTEVFASTRAHAATQDAGHCRARRRPTAVVGQRVCPCAADCTPVKGFWCSRSDCARLVLAPPRRRWQSLMPRRGRPRRQSSPGQSHPSQVRWQPTVHPSISATRLATLCAPSVGQMWSRRARAARSGCFRSGCWRCGARRTHLRIHGSSWCIPRPRRGAPLALHYIEADWAALVADEPVSLDRAARSRLLVEAFGA